MSDFDLYPAGDFDLGTTLLANLGSFWSGVYGDKANLATVLQAELDLFLQTRLDLLQTVASLSRFTTPAFDRKLWTRLTVYKDERNSALINPVRYDTGLTYTEQGTTYNAAEPQYRYRFPAPVNLVASRQVLNRPVLPSLAWVEGADFVVNQEYGYIEFLKDPFETAEFTVYTVSDGNSTRQATDLWLFSADIDLDRVYRKFGYVLGLYGAKNKEIYRDIINAYWDSMQQGPSVESIRKSLASACGLPLVQEQTEQVVHILQHPVRIQVITTNHVYDFPPGSTVVVTPGQTVRYGDLLVSTIRVLEGSQVQQLTETELPALSMGADLLGLPIADCITFRNKQCPVYYYRDTNNHVCTEFDGVDGTDADLEVFWTHVTTTGITTGYSIARALSPYPGATSEPEISQLPTTVNPLQFILSQALDSGVAVCLIQTDALAPDGLLSDLNFLRQILPAHVLILFVSKTSLSVETVDLTLGVTELAVSGFSGQNTDMTETFDLSTAGSDMTPRGTLIDVAG